MLLYIALHPWTCRCSRVGTNTNCNLLVNWNLRLLPARHRVPWWYWGRKSTWNRPEFAQELHFSYTRAFPSPQQPHTLVSLSAIHSKKHKSKQGSADHPIIICSGWKLVSLTKPLLYWWRAYWSKVLDALALKLTPRAFLKVHFLAFPNVQPVHFIKASINNNRCITCYFKDDQVKWSSNRWIQQLHALITNKRRAPCSRSWTRHRNRCADCGHTDASGQSASIDTGAKAAAALVNN